MDNELKSIFNDGELQLINNTVIKDRPHPLKRLFFPRSSVERDSQVLTNTERAFRHIYQVNPQWISNLKPRLLDVDDYSQSSSALSELRAFGYLLEAGIFVRQIGKSGSDFFLESGQEKALVEVHSRQLNRSEAEGLEKFNCGLTQRNYQPREAQGWVVREHRTIPFGQPREHENITENAISKLAAIKGKEHQLSQDNTSILWLYFQDQIWDLLDEPNRVLPVRTWNGAFFSGEFWYAFYGWKGAPIFEGFRLDMSDFIGKVTMRHEGRFRNSTKLDAVILSFSRSTIVLENPYSEKPIKPWLWKKLVFLPWLNFEYSLTNWLVADLTQRISLEQQKLVALSIV